MAACESEEQCLQMLKQWCLLGTESGTKAAHKELWARVVTMVENNALPSMAELDGQVAAAAEEGAS